MRILHVIDHAPPRTSAYSRRIMAILRQQRALGWQTCHLTSGRTQHANELTSNSSKWHFYRTPAARGTLGRLPLIGAVNVLAQRLDQVVQLTRPDLLHAHSPVVNALAALRVGRRHGLPVVFEAHAPSASSPPGSVWSDSAARRRGAVAGEALARFGMRALEAWAAARAGAVITNSEGMQLRLRHGGIPQRKITLVPDALDLRNYVALAPAGQRAPANALVDDASTEAQGAVLIGVAASGQHLEVMLAALALLRRTSSGAALLVSCAPEQFDMVRQAVARHGLDGHVDLLASPAGASKSERMPRRLPDLHRLADVLVFPEAARHLAATPSRKLLEAMAHGCLVIAADTPINRSVIEHGRSGLLFAEDDAEALAGAISVALARRGRWPSLRAAARWFIEYHRTWDICAARYGPVYEKLLAGRRRR
jgi:glycosyltransferase involved in cell wall biosynthesis